jgi:hypothetical protein
MSEKESGSESSSQISMTEAELRQLIRDEIALFGHNGPGWWNSHDPLEYHRCGRCGFLLKMGGGCICGALGNTKIVDMSGEVM